MKEDVRGVFCGDTDHGERRKSFNPTKITTIEEHGEDMHFQ